MPRLFFAVAGCLVGCALPKSYVCDDEAQCVRADGEQGLCEADGNCSYTDPECASGRRYSSWADPAVANQCTDPGQASASTTTTTSAGPTTAVTTATSTPSDSSGSGPTTTAVETTGCAATAWYTDEDGDGFGDPATEVMACEAPPGTVDNADDCDDADVRVRPGGLGCPNPPELLAWYRLDGDGPTLVDSSDGGNDGTLAGADASLGAPGRFGTALRFVGSTAVAEVDAAATALAPGGAPPDEGTIEAWVRLDQAPTQGAPGIALWLGAAGSNGFGGGADLHVHTHYPATQGPAWGGWFTGVGAEATNSFGAAAALADVWTHVAITWQAGEHRLYVDGTLTDTEPLGTLGAPWDVGRLGGPDAPERSLPGTVDEVMVFSVARTVDEIRADCGVCDPS